MFQRSCRLGGLALIGLMAVAAAAAQSPSPTFPPAASKYWLGVEFLPVMPALRAQLNLPARQGLLVEMVTPGSPAAGGGIRQHDVLLRAGDKPLAGPADLIQALDASKGEKLKIDLIRGGKPRTIEIVPALRPEGLGNTVTTITRPVEPSDWETIQKWMEGMWGREDGQISGGHIRIARPVLISRPLPSNMSVVVSRHGDQPAQITVQRGDQKWEISEKELDKLPADVRPFVEQLLGRTMFGLFDATAAEQLQRAPDGGAGDRRLQDRLDEIDRRLEKLFQAVDQLRQQQKRD
jgi:membrane-associated protease RseP (regulator of RpoE activity)